MNVIECAGLGKRYRRSWALRDCTLEMPAGHVVALVGPNGAGKTTLLNLAVGLATPTTGAVTVLGGMSAGSPDALDRIAFVAQDAPLYKNLPVADMVRFVMYADGYGQFPLGRENFLRMPIEHQNVRCIDCTTCAVHCPHGVHVVAQLSRAQELFAC